MAQAICERTEIAVGPRAVERLSWDSRHFGFEVGRIDDPDLDDTELEANLRQAQAGRLVLVYWSTHAGRCPTTALLRRYRGSLADRRVTYAAALAGADVPPTRIIEHPCGPASAAMKRLAIAAGSFSRFAVDPRFPTEAFRRLYETWIERSARHEIAQAVLIAAAGPESTVGLVTVTAAAEKGRIGLIAVDEAQRGRGVGRSLLAAAHQWMQQQGATLSEVVTQADNVPACRLYEHCGYRIERQENTFHFWL